MVAAIAATATALVRFARTDVRRGPRLSITGPAMMLATMYGTISTAATSPIRAALPVVTSTSHGIATIEIRLPTADRTSATNRIDQPAPGLS